MFESGPEFFFIVLDPRFSFELNCKTLKEQMKPTVRVYVPGHVDVFEVGNMPQ